MISDRISFRVNAKNGRNAVFFCFLGLQKTGKRAIMNSDNERIRYMTSFATDDAYNDARKKGIKAMRAAQSEGSYPYLPALDEMLGREGDALSQRNLGIKEIPLEEDTES